MTTRQKLPITFRDALTRSLAHWTFWLTCLAAVAVPSILAPNFADFGGHGGAVDTKATNVPAWTPALAERFPACEAYEAGDLTAAVVVVRQSGDVKRMSTDAAFTINTDDERANDLWVVGTC